MLLLRVTARRAPDESNEVRPYPVSAPLTVHPVTAGARPHPDEPRLRSPEKGNPDDAPTRPLALMAAAAIVAHTTNGNGNGELKKNPAAVALGRLGGLKGVDSIRRFLPVRKCTDVTFRTPV